MKPRNPSIRIVKGGKIIPRETHRLPAPQTLSDGDEAQPWKGKRLDPQATQWPPSAILRVGTAMKAADHGYSVSQPERRSSGLGNLLATIFLGSAALYFIAQAIRLYAAMR